MQAVVLVTVSVLTAAYLGLCSLLIHRSFHSNGWDLGLIHQVIWNSAHGRLFHYSFRDITFAGDHWQPFVLLLAPLEWLWGGPEPLLVVQAIALAAAAVPLYAAGRGLGVPAAGCFALVAAYLFGLGVARAASFDFHAEVFAPLLLFGAFWALASGRSLLFLSLCLATLTLKEDAALAVVAVCWIGWMALGERRVTLATAVVAAVYMAVATSVIIPHFRGDDLNPFLERYGYLGRSPFEVLVGVLTQPGDVLSQLMRPDAIEAVFLVLASGACLPLLKPRLLPALALVTLPALFSRQPEQGALELHYFLVPATVALLIAVVAVRDLTMVPAGGGRASWPSRLPQGWPGALLASTLILWVAWSPLPPSLAAEARRFDVDDHAAVARGFVAEIPPRAVVSAQSAFVPHLSSRMHIYQFPRVLDAEYVLLDSKGTVPAGDRAGYASCREALPALGFVELREDDGISLWRKVRFPEPAPEAPVACSGQHLK